MLFVVRVKSIIKGCFARITQRAKECLACALHAQSHTLHCGCSVGAKGALAISCVLYIMPVSLRHFRCSIRGQNILHTRAIEDAHIITLICTIYRWLKTLYFVKICTWRVADVFCTKQLCRLLYTRVYHKTSPVRDEICTHCYAGGGGAVTYGFNSAKSNVHIETITRRTVVL